MPEEDGTTNKATSDDRKIADKKPSNNGYKQKENY